MSYRRSKTVVLCLLFFLSFLVCLFSCRLIETGTASDNITYYVGGSGEGNYTTIQLAVSAAGAAGGTIYVYSGEYHENIEITSNIILVGENKGTTIIDGNKNGHTISVSGKSDNTITCSISGFTIQNAGGTGNDCIALSRVHSGSIFGNNIVNSDQSSGIQMSHCTSIVIEGNTIVNNDEYGIHMILSSQIVINNNIIQDNDRGIYIDLSSDNTINDNSLTGNHYGIFVLASSSNNVFYRNDFTNNLIRNAEDRSTSSLWYHNNQGNYWDDYTGRDLDGDGIGDIPYDVPGQGSNQDLYPLGYFQSPNEKPIATIESITPSTAVYGTAVSFRGSGFDIDGTIVGYHWSSSLDGSLSTQASFTTSSLSVGLHIISFSVRDNEHEWSTPATDTVRITAPQNQKPVAHIISIQPLEAVFGTPVFFNGYGTDDGVIMEYKWVSDLDGLLSILPTFNSSILSVGTHVISFSVKDDHGVWSDEDIKTVVILSSASQDNNPPVAVITGPLQGVVNTALVFNGSQSYDPDPHGSIVLYRWDFGDGTTQQGMEVEHTYTSTGLYTLTLQVTDNTGTQSSTSQNVQITVADETSNGPSDNGEDDAFPIPLIVIAPIAGILLFAGIILAFFRWMKQS